MNLLLQSSLRRTKVPVAILICLFVLQNTSFATNTARMISAGKSSTARVNVTGTVTDIKGEPLPGVTVKVKGTNTGTTTDINGVFRLNLPVGDETLVFTYIGFASREVKVTGTEITVRLEESTSSLDEVVVTGYGTKKKSELIGSVATISPEEIQDIPASNIAGMLRGRIAGLGVSQSSGRPGSSISLNIRNSTTTETPGVGGTAEPLYIIDGITVDKGTFDNLDPSMIESMSILKDASAAIYGAAGAKGVLLINTKRGKAGKISIGYNGYVGVSDASKKTELLSGYDHAMMLNESNKINNAAATEFFSPEDLEYIKGLNYKSWYDELWQASLTQRHNLNISGGNDKVTFFAGGSYSNENANYAGLQYDKYSFRSGLSATVIEGLKADVAFNVDHSVRLANHNVSESDENFFESMLTIPRWIPISIDGKPINYVNGNIRNPMGILESGYYDNNKSKGYRINASLSYEPAFLKGLTAKFQISQGSSAANSRQYSAPYNLYDFVRTGSNNQFFTNQPAEEPIKQIVTPQAARVMPGLQESNSYQAFFTLNYAKTFGIHSIAVTAGGEQTVSNSERLSVYWTDQLIPDGEDWWAFNPTNLTRQAAEITENTKRSFFSRLSYDFNKKYLVEAVARYDASSNFAKGNRWGLSPSVGLGWIISNEDFFKDNVSFVDFLKFKVNYGVTGDDRVQSRFWQDRYLVDVTNGYLFGNTNGNGLNPGAFPNPLITWEKKKTFNAGIDASLFKNKLDIGVEFFRNKTYDGFDKGLDDMYPLYAGFQAPVVNYREAYSWGSEFTIGYKTKIGKDFSVSSSINFGYGNSVVDKMIFSAGKLVENTPGDWLIGFGTDPRVYNSSNIGLVHKGMLRTQAEADAFLMENPNYKLYNRTPEAGWLIYEDTNEDGVINDMDMVTLFNGTNPFFSSGINLNLGYKAFSLNTSINARLGGKVFYDGKARNAPTPFRNVIFVWDDRWSAENPDGKFPRSDDPTIAKNSDFWAVDGTMIRINNMTLSYKVPSRVANRLGLGSARIMATGNNLWTLVNPLKYKDPYTSSAYDYPMLRTISLGLSVNF